MMPFVAHPYLGGHGARSDDPAEVLRDAQPLDFLEARACQRPCAMILLAFEAAVAVIGRAPLALVVSSVLARAETVSSARAEADSASPPPGAQKEMARSCSA